MSFSSNDLKFGMFIYYTCVDFCKNFRIEFSFILFEQRVRNKIHFKV